MRTGNILLVSGIRSGGFVLGLFCCFGFVLEGAQNNHWKVDCVIIALHSKIIFVCV